MTIQDTFSGAHFVARITAIAAARGLELRVGADFAAYRRMVAKERPQQPVGQPFDARKQALGDDNAFWIAGRDRAGRLVHTQAMRRIDLPGTLADFLRRKFRDFPPAGVGLDLARSRYVAGPGARAIAGRVCYHGEAWLCPEAGFRGTGMAGVLARFALAGAVLRWAPDYVFGFMSEGLAFRGLVEREGYMHTDPGVLRWQPAGGGAVMTGFMVWMGRADLRHMMGLAPERLLHARSRWAGLAERGRREGVPA